MEELIVRIENTDEFFDRLQASARQIDRGDLSPTAASLSLSSMSQLLDVLSKTRWSLLSVLREAGPSSIRALSKLVDRDYRGVHSDVARLLDAGLIEKNETGKVFVPWSKITAEVYLDRAA